MKDFIKMIILSTVCIMIAGCSARPIEINEIIRDYLALCNVENSRLTSMDYKGISEYTVSTTDIKFSEISKRIDEVLEYYFKRQSCDGHKIISGDAVSLNIEIADTTGTSIACAPTSSFFRSF